MGLDAVSDRVYKSKIYPIKALDEAFVTAPDADVNLRTLEIAFDRTCQFACSYCNPSYSTTWVKDIQQNGPYVGLTTDKGQHYESTHAGSDPYYGNEANPYIEAFWKWWPDLKKSLKQLRITGGEPLMSNHFWKLLDLLKEDSNSPIQLAVNSNLGSRPELIQKLITASHELNNLEIYTSNEAFGSQAEYIRDGLNFELWKTNFTNLKRHGKVNRIHVMMTINGLCLFSITELLDQMLEWKAEFGKATPTFSLNIVRWPTFQSPLVLPQALREEVTNKFKAWFAKNEKNPLIQNYEADHCRRLIQYLEKAEEPTHGAASRQDLEIDLKKFLLQYDKRRNKNYKNSFQPVTVDWINSIEVPRV
jgi:organic radical activating enzyme